jgi:hypothetical protein
MSKVDDYIKLLEKRASNFDGGKTGPSYDHDIDSAVKAIGEKKRNLEDNCATLKMLLSNFDSSSKNETNLAKKLFKETKYPHESSAPLVKLAMSVLGTSKKFASATPAYQFVTVQAFKNELEKIAE